MATREELVVKAEELDISVTEDMKDEDIQTKITEIEDKKVLDATDDPEKLKERIKFLEKESKVSFDKRDRALKDKRTLQSKLKSLEDKIDTSIDPEEVKKLKTAVKDLKEFKKTKDLEDEEKDLKNKTDLEIEKVRSEKKEKALQVTIDEISERLKTVETESSEETEKSKKTIKRLRQSRLGSEIIKEAAKLNAWSPDQVVRLLKDDFEFDEDLGRHVVHTRDTKGKIVDELEVTEYVTSFLKASENENLIKSKAATDGFNSDKQTKALDTKATQTSSKKYDSKDPDLIKKADRESMTVDRYIKTLVLRDKRMEEINEARKS